MSDALATQRSAARTAGIAILLVLASGGFAQFFVFLRLPANTAGVTARNILDHQFLFRFGIALALASAVFGIVEIWALYVLLKPYLENLALLGLLAQLAGSVLVIGTMRDNYLVLHLLGAPGFLAPFSSGQLQSAAQLLLAYDDGLRTSLIFSAFGAIIFAWIFFRSRCIPRALSAYLLFADAFTVVSCFSIALAPDTGQFLFPWFPLANFLGLLSLALWLTIKGVAVRPKTSEVTA